MLVLTVASSRAEFYAREVAELAGGPILVEATTGHPAGDYFLVSASVVDPTSAVGESLQQQQFDQHSLLFMRGETVLVELSAAQQTELISWLKHTVLA